MDTTLIVTKTTKEEVYDEILPQLKSLLEGEEDWIANLANTSSVLRFAFPDRISWAGFYLKGESGLVLGPFQGKPACVRITIGKGVCGTAAATMKTVIVPDVHAFPGHIACDPDSRSEIVVPMLHNGRLLGVLDLDSTSLNSFDEADAAYLEKVIKLLISSSKVPSDNPF